MVDNGDHVLFDNRGNVIEIDHHSAGRAGGLEFSAYRDLQTIRVTMWSRALPLVIWQCVGGFESEVFTYLRSRGLLRDPLIQDEV